MTKSGRHLPTTSAESLRVEGLVSKLLCSIPHGAWPGDVPQHQQRSREDAAQSGCTRASGWGRVTCVTPRRGPRCGPRMSPLARVLHAP